MAAAGCRVVRAHQPVRTASDRRARDRGAEGRLEYRASSPARINAASASPSPMPAWTPRASRPSRRRSPAATSSTARRCGRRRLRSPTRSCCSRARRNTRTASVRPTASPFSTPTSTAAHIEVRRIPKMGRKAVDLECHLHRQAVHPGGKSHRRGGPWLFLHPRQPQSRAHPRRHGGDRHRHRCTRPRREVRARARRIRSPDRTEPGDPASARRALDGPRGREPDGAARGAIVRHRQALRRGGELRRSSSVPVPAMTPRCRRS